MEGGPSPVALSRLTVETETARSLATWASVISFSSWVAEPLEQRDRRLADVGEQPVDQAGHEQRHTHGQPSRVASWRPPPRTIPAAARPPGGGRGDGGKRRVLRAGRGHPGAGARD